MMTCSYHLVTSELKMTTTLAIHYTPSPHYYTPSPHYNTPSPNARYSLTCQRPKLVANITPYLSRCSNTTVINHDL